MQYFSFEFEVSKVTQAIFQNIAKMIAWIEVVIFKDDFVPSF